MPRKQYTKRNVPEFIVSHRHWQETVGNNANSKYLERLETLLSEDVCNWEKLVCRFGGYWALADDIERNVEAVDKNTSKKIDRDVGRTFGPFLRTYKHADSLSNRKRLRTVLQSLAGQHQLMQAAQPAPNKESENYSVRSQSLGGYTQGMNLTVAMLLLGSSYRRHLSRKKAPTEMQQAQNGLHNSELLSNKNLDAAQSNKTVDADITRTDLSGVQEISMNGHSDTSVDTLKDPQQSTISTTGGEDHKEPFSGSVSECQAFAVMYHLMSELHIGNLYRSDAPILDSYIQCFGVYLKEQAPTVAKTLQQAHFATHAFAIEWFTTLFATVVPVSVGMCVVDLIMSAKLDNVCFRFATAALLSVPGISTMSVDDLMLSLKPTMSKLSFPTVLEKAICLPNMVNILPVLCSQQPEQLPHIFHGAIQPILKHNFPLPSPMHTNSKSDLTSLRASPTSRSIHARNSSVGEPRIRSNQRSTTLSPMPHVSPLGSRTDSARTTTLLRNAYEAAATQIPLDENSVESVATSRKFTSGVELARTWSGTKSVFSDRMRSRNDSNCSNRSIADIESVWSPVVTTDKFKKSSKTFLKSELASVLNGSCSWLQVQIPKAEIDNGTVFYHVRIRIPLANLEKICVKRYSWFHDFHETIRDIMDKRPQIWSPYRRNKPATSSSICASPANPALHSESIEIAESPYPPNRQFPGETLYLGSPDSYSSLRFDKQISQRSNCNTIPEYCAEENQCMDTVSDTASVLSTPNPISLHNNGTSHTSRMIEWHSSSDLPPIPPKKFIFSKNRDFIEKRRSALQSFLSALSSTHSPLITGFIPRLYQLSLECSMNSSELTPEQIEICVVRLSQPRFTADQCFDPWTAVRGKLLEFFNMSEASLIGSLMQTLRDIVDE